MAFINLLNEFSLQIENARKDKFDVEKKLEVNMIDKQIEELNNRKAILENTKLESGYQYRK